MDSTVVDCSLVLQKYKLKYPELMNNPILQSFLSNSRNLKLFKQAICRSKLEDKMALNNAFKEHYLTIRFTSYMSKLIYFEAINFDKKIRRQNETQLLTLDAPTVEDSEITYINNLPEENNKYLPYKAFEHKQKNLEDIITDKKLLNAVSLLTHNQKEILELAYVEQLKDVEIAKVLKKSQQTISKSHQKALKIIRKTLQCS